ncbi:MAG TPA: AraC family transcriptional regulator [Sphingobacterium sp.]|nr:AraC family transcriptional regulator [Sphingobacterium sp.]
MKIKQLTLQPAYFQSFNIRRDKAPQNHNIWHYHEELELILVLKGSGRLFVGDCIQEFSENDMILIGSNVPHYWLFNGEARIDSGDNTINCIVVHFKQNFLGRDFTELPEARFFKELNLEAKRALYSRLPVKHRIHTLLKKVLERQGILRVIAFLETLLVFKNTYPKSLISDKYTVINHSDDVKRMNIIMEFIRENFTNQIELRELAHLAGMTKNSFSRYFKQKTGKTPIQLIFELRVAHACKLLGNPDHPLKEICYEAGFNNPVSFHKAFKNIKYMTPRTYRNHVLRN